MSTLDTEDLERIAILVESKLHHETPARQNSRERFVKHLPRRCVLIGVVLVVGAAIHFLIEETVFRSALQSCGIGMAALIEAAFNKIREEL